MIPRLGKRKGQGWRVSSMGLLALACALAAAPAAQAKRPPGFVPKMRAWFAYGVRYTQPQRAAVSFTVMRAPDPDEVIVDGCYVEAEPGLGGGKVSVGWGSFNTDQAVWIPKLFGFGFKASVMRTWGSPQGAPPGETLVGSELGLTLAYAKVSAGYLWRVAGRPGPGGHFTWGVGVGF